MKLFLAATSSRHYLKDIVFESMYNLESFWYIKEWQYPLIEKSKMFLLDSGAFTYMNAAKGSAPDPKLFQDRYVEFINEHGVDYFFNLDLDTLIGPELTKQMRRDLEQRTGKKSIPVFHKCMGLKVWHEICEEYDYVAIGTIYEYKSDRRVLRKLCGIADTYGTRVHGLGFTGKNAIDFGFYSVDSSSWVAGARFGTVYNFKGGELFLTSAPEGMRTVNHRILDRHNYQQWCLYQQYLDRRD